MELEKNNRVDRYNELQKIIEKLGVEERGTLFGTIEDAYKEGFNKGFDQCIDDCIKQTDAQWRYSEIRKSLSITDPE